MTKPLLLLTLYVFFTSFAYSQNPDDYRGGWRTDNPNGSNHTYEFTIAGETVRGIYCTRCSDATTLAFVDGKLGPSGLTFTVTHVRTDGRTEYQDKATAKFDQGKLIVTGESPRGGKFNWTMIKDPRGPDPLPIPVVTIPPSNVPVLGGRGGPQGVGPAPAAPKPVSATPPAPAKPAGRSARPRAGTCTGSPFLPEG